MHKFFSWFSKALGDGENPSSARIIAMSVLLVVNISPVLVWDMFAIHALLFSGATALPEYPGTVIGMQTAISTPLLGYLYLHKKEEGVQNATG